jgi:Putative MetA-pathway of phenol degradation
MLRTQKHVGLLLFQLLFLSGVVNAQFYETIRSGRPGQSIGASTMGKNVFQIQSGVDYFGAENNEYGLKTRGFLTNAGLRYGLTEMFEVGAFFEYKNESTTSNDITTSYSGLSNLVVGLRHQISVGEGLKPGIGFQFRLRLPVMSEHYQIDNLAPSFVFVTSQQLSKSVTLITNLGDSWNGMDSTPTGFYTVNLSCAFTATFGSFIENYGSVTQGTFDTLMDAGVAWLLTPNLQLDLFGGYSSNRGLQEYFISTGISWRTKCRSKPIS